MLTIELYKRLIHAISFDVNFMERRGPCWFCSYMNIYGSTKHHLVRERTEVAIICEADNDIRPHIIPLGKSTFKRTDRPSCLPAWATCKFAKEHCIAVTCLKRSKLLVLNIFFSRETESNRPSVRTELENFQRATSFEITRLLQSVRRRSS